MSRYILLFTIILGLLALQCSRDSNTNITGTSPGSDESASITLHFNKPAHVSHLVAMAEAVVSAPDMDTMVQQLTVTDSSVTGTIDSIPAGPHRKFEIFVYDEDTTLTYSGEAFSDVPAGAVLTLQIVLYPVDHTGTVIIVGTFAPFPPSNDYALEFDGIDDWVNVGDRDQLEFDTKDFTLSAWFKTETTGLQQHIIRKGLDNRTSGEGRWVLKVHSNNVIKIVLDDIQNHAGSTFESEGSTIVTDGQWHHVAAVFDRDQALRVYLDGQLEIEDNRLTYHSAPIKNTANINAYIGRSNAHGKYFSGLLDEIRVWEAARSQTEIQADMNRHLQGNEAHLIAYWRMDEGSGQVLTDYASDNHGQLGSTPGSDPNDPIWVETTFPHTQ